MKRIADILAEELFSRGLNQVFMVTGGGAMHLNDALGRCQGMRVLFNHHEQACAMAAEGYARLCNRPAIVNVTTGPGGINALNGVYGAYVDSVPMVVLSGQIKRDTMQRNCAYPLRQLGDQEVDIIPMVRPVTKYAVTLQDPRQVREVAAKAVWLACHGRPGPVWIDVPMDVQGMRIDEKCLSFWDAEEQGNLSILRGDPNLHPNTLGDFVRTSPEHLARCVGHIVERLRSARRPVVLAGSGVRLSGMEEAFYTLLEKLGIPAVGGWNAYDLIADSHPCYAGRPGTVGDRAGNFSVQSADFLLVLGCRLNIRQISYNWHAFAPDAWKAQVDVDPGELSKPTLSNDLQVQADLRQFMPLLLEALAEWTPPPAHAAYLDWCRQRVRKYPVLPPEGQQGKKINPYAFMAALFDQLEEGDAVVAANATAAVVSAQVGALKPGVRLFSNSGAASMGYDLPAALGAAVSGRAKRIICLAGDGSIMMNIQELQTIVGNKLPLHIFLLHNEGYLSIKLSQGTHFPDNRLGTAPNDGVTFPDFARLGEAFGLHCETLADGVDLAQRIGSVLGQPAPYFCQVMLDPDQGFEPKLASRVLPDGSMVSPALDDMAPFLSPQELAANRWRG